jgi:hypothetical protein
MGHRLFNPGAIRRLKIRVDPAPGSEMASRRCTSGIVAEELEGPGYGIQTGMGTTGPGTILRVQGA